MKDKFLLVGVIEEQNNLARLFGLKKQIFIIHERKYGAIYERRASCMVFE